MPTKEQVLKRMAEIEGWVSFKPDPDVWYRKDSKVEFDDELFCYTFVSVDPLDNPSDWAGLIEKHEISLWKEDGDWWAITKELDNSPLRVQNHPALPWAICMAIIEANGGMGDE